MRARGRKCSTIGRRFTTGGGGARASGARNVRLSVDVPSRAVSARSQENVKRGTTMKDGAQGAGGQAAPDDAQERFERLQKKLVPLWRSIRALGQDEQTIVVAPSITVDFDLKGSEMQAYEERFLFLLL